jgi:branched-chain amino acid aminotransferase
LFVVRQGKVLTPPLSEGCIDGIMRMQVIDILSSDGSAFFEMPLSTEDLESADEIWFTNVVQGVAFARKFRERSYSGEWASRITEKMNQKFTI